MDTFTKEIKFLSNSFDGEKAIQVTAAKTATFQELSRTERSQHELHFEIIGLMVGNKTDELPDEDDKKVTAKLDMAMVGSFVRKAIKTLLIVDNNFTEIDKKEFLQDSGALIKFALWYVPGKVTPFFSTLSET